MQRFYFFLVINCLDRNTKTSTNVTSRLLHDYRWLWSFQASLLFSPGCTFCARAIGNLLLDQIQATSLVMFQLFFFSSMVEPLQMSTGVCLYSLRLTDFNSLLCTSFKSINWNSCIMNGHLFLSLKWRHQIVCICVWLHLISMSVPSGLKDWTPCCITIQRLRAKEQVRIMSTSLPLEFSWTFSVFVLGLAVQTLNALPTRAGLKD